VSLAEPVTAPIDGGKRQQRLF